MPQEIIIGRNPADKALFGKKGLIFLGKHFVKMGQVTSLSNPIFMDVARSHVVLIAGKRGCLTGDTLVFTDKGYKPIKEFDEKKDKILSFNKNEKQFEWEKAELLKYPIYNEDLLRIKFEDNKEIKLTREHPLLVVTGNKLLSLLWLKANQLKIGDKILSVGKNFEDLKPLKIKEISNIRRIKEVYDLSVNKNHSFIANGIISHNSGKSYTLGVIAEELSNLPEEISSNIAPLIFDTMGIYWTMSYRNEKEYELLQKWGLESQKLPVRVFVPKGKIKVYDEKNIPYTNTFLLDVTDMTVEDWLSTFGLNYLDPVSIVIERNLEKLENKTYDINDIIKTINADKQASKENSVAATSLFQAAQTWGVFGGKKDEAIKAIELTKGGITTVLDLSCYSSIGAFNVRALVIGLITRKLFSERMEARKSEEIEAVRHGIDYLSMKEERKMPLVWLMIDEAHEFLPKAEEGKTAATEALIQILREGRQPGMSLVLATQQPGQIHKDVMTQSDIVISHRVTASFDIEALNQIMQTYVLGSIKTQLDNLPRLKGSAIILDDNSERIYPMRVRPRFTWHGGEAPTALRVERRI